MVKSTHNVTHTLKKDQEFLVMGQCYDENPRFALTAMSTTDGVVLNIHDNSDTIRIIPDENGGAVYNFTDQLSLIRDFEWHTANDKR